MVKENSANVMATDLDFLFFLWSGKILSAEKFQVDIAKKDIITKRLSICSQCWDGIPVRNRNCLPWMNLCRHFLLTMCIKLEHVSILKRLYGTMHSGCKGRVMMTWPND